MPRYKLTVAYDGTNFHGWQKQEPPDSDPLRTVQGVLEQAVREAVREPVNVLGASRTDAGVHALGQVAAFTSQTTIPTGKMARAITARLPEDIQVLDAGLVPDDFSPITDCLSKGYRFSIAHGGQPRTDEPDPPQAQPAPPPLFDRHIVYYTYHRLDPARMNQAAQHLVGEHDFASFAQINHGRDSTIRTIFECSVTPTDDERCHIDVSGNGFLYNMVRIIAGTLVAVGRGQMEPERILHILKSCDRREAGPTLPPEGLCLSWIRYKTLAIDAASTATD